MIGVGGNRNDRNVSRHVVTRKRTWDNSRMAGLSDEIEKNLTATQDCPLELFTHVARDALGSVDRNPTVADIASANDRDAVRYKLANLDDPVRDPTLALTQIA
jgi:hypothetical protein